MRKPILSIFTFILFLGFSTSLSAQQKIGCIDSNELISAMPENDSAQAVIEAKTNEFVMQSQELQTELNKKYEAFLAQADSLSPLIKQTKQSEINDMAKNVETFNAAADQELQRLRQEIYQPILDKAQTAVREVAQEGEFTYIIDLGTRVALFFPEEAPLNILEAVKVKLGLIANKE